MWGVTGGRLVDDSSSPDRVLPPRPAATSPFVVERAVRFVAVHAPVRPRARRAGVPQRIVVPRLGVDAPVTGIRAPGHVLLPPGDPQVLGWWRAGARPGAERGSAIIAGHTVHTGGGAFDDLEALRPGDRVTVRTTAGAVGYEVVRVRIYRKATLAHDSARVFSQTVPGRLVLVTCEDWNGSTYLSNAVVVATPLS